MPFSVPSTGDVLIFSLALQSTVEPHGFRQMAPNTQKHRSPPAVHIAGGRELTYTSHPGIRGKNHVHKNARKRERVLVISSKSYICKFIENTSFSRSFFIGRAITIGVYIVWDVRTPPYEVKVGVPY